MRILWKTLKRLLLALLAVVLLSFVALTITSAVLGHRVAARLDDLRRAGEPVSMEEIARITVPESQNAAPLYEKAIAILHQPARSADIALLTGPGPAPGRLGHPSLKTPVTSEQWAEASAAVGRNRDLLDALEKAEARPVCQLSYQRRDGELQTTLLPEVGSLLNASQIQRLAVLLQVRAGHPEALADSLSRESALSKVQYGNKPFIITELIGFVHTEIACSTVRESMRFAKLDEATARRLFDILAGIHPGTGLADARRSERAIWLTTMEDLARGAPWSTLTAAIPDGRPITWGPAEYLLNKLPLVRRPWIYANMLAYLDAMDQRIAVLRYSYREAKTRDLVRDDEFLPAHPSLAERVTSGMKLIARRDMTVATVGATQIALALHVFRNRYGEYPPNLAELRAKLPWPLPADPFSGADFRYVRDGTGYLLYSVGKNLKDDGGVRSKPREEPVKDDLAFTPDT